MQSKSIIYKLYKQNEIKRLRNNIILLEYHLGQFQNQYGLNTSKSELRDYKNYFISKEIFIRELEEIINDV